MSRPPLIAAAIGALALAGCQDPPRPGQAEQLSSLLSARLGRHVELHHVETETDGVHATCGYAGDPPRRSTTTPPSEDVTFIWAAGKLAVSSDARPDFEDLVQRNCPSLPRNRVAAVP